MDRYHIIRFTDGSEDCYYLRHVDNRGRVPSAYVADVIESWVPCKTMATSFNLPQALFFVTVLPERFKQDVIGYEPSVKPFLDELNGE